MRGRVGQQRLLRLEVALFIDVVDPGCGDLVELESQEVELPGPRPFVAPERVEVGAEPLLFASRVLKMGPRRDAGSPAKWSSASRCAAVARRDWWACWPCKSTSEAPIAASSAAVASLPSM